MNKDKVFNFLLVFLPIMAMGIASTDTSVTIYDRAADVYTYQSYFDLLPEGTFQSSTVLSMMLTTAALVMGIVYLFNKKQTLMTGVYLSTFAAVFAAEIPSLMQSDLFILPNMMVPVLLIADCAIAYYRMKKAEKKNESKGQRLRRR